MDGLGVVSSQGEKSASSAANNTAQASADVEACLMHAAKLLPAQGPITAFVFLNSLQALEDLPFEEGMVRGSELFGNESYLTEDRYRSEMALGRIRHEDLSDALLHDLGSGAGEAVGPGTSRYELRMAMLSYPLRTAPVAELQWFIAEAEALSCYLPEAPAEVIERCIEESRQWAMRELRDASLAAETKPLVEALPDVRDAGIEQWTHARWTTFSLRALWEVCRLGVQDVPIPNRVTRSVRHRNLFRHVTEVDSDRVINDLLIPFCAAFIDQGLASWELPRRDEGLWVAFAELYRHASLAEAWTEGLREELDRLRDLKPAEVVLDALRDLGVSEAERDEFLTRELLALRGYAGMLWQSEDRGDRLARSSPPGTIVAYMAVRLVLTRVALRHLARRELNYTGPLNELRQYLKDHDTPEPRATTTERAVKIFQLAQMLGWSAAALSKQTPEEWRTLIDEIESFPGIQRRRLFHLAFERQFRVRALDALDVHVRGKQPTRVVTPSFQAVFCIDAREESFRRHLEEVCPNVETFGAAGFFGVAMYYKGVSDAHYQALCPIVVRPKNWVTEEVVYSLAESDHRRATARKRLATASHRLHVGSRSMAGGALLTAGLGVFASFPLVARVLFPRTTSRIRSAIGSVVAPPPVTRLRLERLTEQPGSTGDAIGYSLKEMADVGERMLNEIGLRTNFARIVFFFGHGSFCLNNPHKSAYDCGACSGSAGGPNGRALAMMLNDPRVRRLLAERGVQIPETTTFIGGLHNTTTDSFTFYDLDMLPRTFIPDFEAARDCLERACERNAMERCRRFYSAPLDISPTDARLHVESRAEDLAQTRPEFGNASNAMCVVGRRSRTRGLYLDRRSFLVSYDPELDDAESTILGRILGAVVIVCSGINLQYFFSYMAPSHWGAGTKLPHNITSLLGVMDGAASDLRSGLPWQGVEIHEPMRLLFVIETTPQSIQKIMNRNPAVGNILRNGWAQLALLDPETAKLSLYQNGEFHPYVATIDELPQVKESADWFRGWRGHLDFAQVRK